MFCTLLESSELYFSFAFVFVGSGAYSAKLNNQYLILMIRLKHQHTDIDHLFLPFKHAVHTCNKKYIHNKINIMRGTANKSTTPV